MYYSVLAEIHDRWFPQFANGAAHFIQSRYPLLTSSAFFDLGCGSGTLLKPFYPMASRVYGVDVSEAMIEKCRERMPDGQFETIGIFEANLHRAAVFTAVGEIVSFAAGSHAEPLVAINALLTSVANHMEPNGVFLFDFLNDAVDFNYKKQFEQAEYAVYVESSHNDHIVRRDIVSYLKQEKGYQRSVETHKLRVFNAGQIKQFAEAAGFSVENLTSYADFPLPPGRSAFVCTRRKTN